MADKVKNAEEVKAAGKEEKNKAEAKPKKPKVKLSERVGKFFREYKSELKKIVWYSKEDTIRSTVLVLVAIIVFSVIISTLDFLFSSGLLAIGRLI
ncbi:MAG TPA: preprotein translocase subunit SecE [Bacillota bacterium]|nr:preprotein translocase subunit SecE [Clostridiales bacterium]HPT85639.1 preprotein translocase subunit SecE [Bacillota bacterium]